jgi:hypothetical protein
MANAAFSSLASQAAITLINNKGDIGKTLRDLGRSSTAKAALAAALSAGFVQQVGQSAGLKELAGDLGKAGVPEKLTYNLINATGRALTNTAINGGSLEDALKSSLVGALVDTAHGQAASAIKSLEGEYLAHKLAHALAGCVAGAAAGGACKDGAIGAAVGEMVAGLMPPKNGIAYSDTEKANVLALSKLVAGATSAYAGGNAQTAITTAETAVQNNALVPVIVGLAWLADKAWTAYEVSQDIAAIRDGTKTVQQVAQEKGEEYVAGIILGNVARFGVKAVKAGGIWVQTRDPFSNMIESRSRWISGSATGGAPFSNLVPGGGLAAHEAVGGHLLARHVGQSEAALAARLAGEPNLGVVSTFVNRTEAEAAISGVLSARAADVNAWVAAGARGRLVIDGAFSGGAVLQRGAAVALPGTGVKAILEGTGGGGWRIITGYPTR